MHGLLGLKSDAVPTLFGDLVNPVTVDTQPDPEVVADENAMPEPRSPFSEREFLHIFLCTEFFFIFF